MRLMAILACVLVASLAVAGCASKSNGGTSSSSSSSHSVSGTSSSSSSTSHSSSSTSQSSTSTSSGPSDSAPTGSISASVGNGSLPLKVNFTLTGTDQDHDTLVWDLTFGDGNKTNGTTLPATVSHSYTKAGNFTAIYTVTDGKTPTSYNVTIKVKGGAGGASTQDVKGTIQAATNIACAGGAIPYDTIPMTAGVTYILFTIEPGTIGKAFTATFASGAATDHVLFLGSDGKTIKDFAVGLPGTSWTAAGTVPAASANGVFYGCGGTPSEDVVYHAG